MRRYPKIALGLITIAIAAIFLGLTLSVRHLNKPSTFNLTSEQNKFNLKFNLSTQDKKDFAKIIEKLALTASTNQGVTFTLDSTSSAMLTFETPINGQLHVKSNQVTFSGQLDRPLKTKDIEVESFRFPKNLNFATAAENLTENAQKYLNIPQQIGKDIEQNSALALQIIAFFGEQNNGVYIFKTGNFDIDSYKNQSAGVSGITIKEETIEGTKFSLLNNLASFQIGEWTFLTTSFDSAKGLFQHQKDPKDSIYFPPKGNSASPTIALFYQDTAASPVAENLLLGIFGSKEKIPGFLSKIEKMDLIVNQKDFYGAVTTKEK